MTCGCQLIEPTPLFSRRVQAVSQAYRLLVPSRQVHRDGELVLASRDAWVRWELRSSSGAIHYRDTGPASYASVPVSQGECWSISYRTHAIESTSGYHQQTGIRSDTQGVVLNPRPTVRVWWERAIGRDAKTMFGASGGDAEGRDMGGLTTGWTTWISPPAHCRYLLVMPVQSAGADLLIQTLDWAGTQIGYWLIDDDVGTPTSNRVMTAPVSPWDVLTWRAAGGTGNQACMWSTEPLVYRGGV